MLKRRIIPVVLYRGETVVKGERFRSWRSVGHVRQAAEVYASRGVDEIIFLDIGATPENRDPDFDLIRDLTAKFYGPVTVGGGIRTLDHFQQALANGADKVCICTAAYEDRGLVSRAAKRFGSQAVVVSVDYTFGMGALDFEAAFITVRGERSAPTIVDPVFWAREAARNGAGEILLNSIDRDGILGGYDLEMIRRVSSAVNVPVVACGGCGAYHHMAEAFDAGADAAAAGAFWIWDDATPAGASRYLHERGYAVRLIDEEKVDTGGTEV